MANLVVALKNKGGQALFDAIRKRREHKVIQRELAMMYQMRVPTPLSLQAQWMELRPQSCHPWDWWLLFDNDKDLWPFIAELIKEEYGA